MKFSKSLLAVIAMAGTMGFSAVASAMEAEVYGSLRGGYNSFDQDDAKVVGGLDTTTAVPVITGANYMANDPAKADEGLDAQTEIGHGNFGSRIGIRGTEDLGNGAESGFRWESAVGDKGDLASNGRLANVWYSGAFGKITIGQQATPYNSAANWDQSWWLGGNANFGSADLAPRMRDRFNGIRYDGSAGAFNFSVAAAALDNARAKVEARENVEAVQTDVDADATYDNANDLEGYVDYNAVGETETGVDLLIATGHYDMGVAQVNLGYYTNANDGAVLGESYDAFVISAQGSLDALDWYVGFQSATDNFAGATVDGIYAQGTDRDDATADTAVVRATANEVNYDATQKYLDSLTTNYDVDTIAFFLGYNISNASLVYLEWEDSANDGLDRFGENLDRTQTLLGFSRQLGPNTSFIAEYAAVDYNSELTGDSTQLQGYLKIDF